MRSLKRPALLALVSLAACAGPELPPDLINRVDGDYKGRGLDVLAQSPNCPAVQKGMIEIGDHVLVFAYTPQTIFIVPIGPDGQLFSRVGGVQLDGALDNGRLLFKISSPECVAQYRLDWKI